MFVPLNQFVAGVIAGYFSGGDGSDCGAGSGPLCAWFMPAASDKPETRAGYTLQISANVHRGAAKTKHRDALGNLVAEETTCTAHLILSDPPAGLPWLPVRHQTTLLLGVNFETAEAFRIVDFDELGGRLELQLEAFKLF